MTEDPSAESVPDEPAAAVPNVIGLDAADACEMIRTAGLVPAGPDDSAAPTVGVIQAQVPAGGLGATVGQAVTLHTEPGNLAPG